VFYRVFRKTTEPIRGESGDKMGIAKMPVKGWPDHCNPCDVLGSPHSLAPPLVRRRPRRCWPTVVELEVRRHTLFDRNTASRESLTQSRTDRFVQKRIVVSHMADNRIDHLRGRQVRIEVRNQTNSNQGSANLKFRRQAQ
jgi:hypothetical protein